MKITFINSTGHWRNGWLSSPSELQLAIEILRSADIEVDSVEVASVKELEKTLNSISADTLIWSNAYYVNEGRNNVIWLNDYIENRDVPLIGSSAATLRHVLQKDTCQTILQKANLPIPPFAVITRKNMQAFPSLLKESGIDCPIVLKPTAESGSVGVSQAHTLEEAIQQAQQILATYPQSNVIVEPFLPSDDVTCGYLRLGDEVLLLPTYYIVKSKPGAQYILGREERLRLWDDTDKIQPCITEENVLAQLEIEVPAIVDALDIRETTRVDGRLDKDGKLRFFDVNGLPALCFPESVMVKQCISCFPNYDPKIIYERLIYTLVHNALLRYNMVVPRILQDNHLFALESMYAIKSTVSPVFTNKVKMAV